MMCLLFHSFPLHGSACTEAQHINTLVSNLASLRNTYHITFGERSLHRAMTYIILTSNTQRALEWLWTKSIINNNYSRLDNIHSLEIILQGCLRAGFLCYSNYNVAHIQYCIRSLFGSYFNLAVWRFFVHLPDSNDANIAS